MRELGMFRSPRSPAIRRRAGSNQAERRFGHPGPVRAGRFRPGEMGLCVGFGHGRSRSSGYWLGLQRSRTSPAGDVGGGWGEMESGASNELVHEAQAAGGAGRAVRALASAG